jgi:ferredoxin
MPCVTTRTAPPPAVSVAVGARLRSPRRRVVCFSARRNRQSRASASSGTPPASALGLVLSPEAKEYYRGVLDSQSGDDESRLLDAAPCDFFELLGVDTGASAVDVKAAFRKLQRCVHPDIAGAAAEPLAVLLNSAYATLMDDIVREAYKKTVEASRRVFANGSLFDGRPVSKWNGPDTERAAVFVDESACIGCKSCTLYAPNTFEMVEDFNAGRARCTTQWGNDLETTQIAIELCPVDCIFWVQRSELPILEYAMKGCKREDIAIMARRRSGNMGSAPSGTNPFANAERMLKMRREGKAFLNEAGEGGTYKGHDEKLGGAITAAWLALPNEAREKGWPSWSAPIA